MPPPPSLPPPPPTALAFFHFKTLLAAWAAKGVLNTLRFAVAGYKIHFDFLCPDASHLPPAPFTDPQSHNTAPPQPFTDSSHKAYHTAPPQSSSHPAQKPPPPPQPPHVAQHKRASPPQLLNPLRAQDTSRPLSCGYPLESAPCSHSYFSCSTRELPP
ncbi:unnamed protein product [Closterium sp. NIES-54]